MDTEKPGGTFADATASELRAWLAAIVDQSEDAIVSKTLDGIITSWNRSAERLFGYTAAEAIGRHIFLIVPDDRREEELEVLAALQRGERVGHFETVRQTKQGRRVDISLAVSPIRDTDGRLIGASKVARDITDKKRAAEELKRAHEELEMRVRERTAELSSANEFLRAEMTERQRVEQERIRLLTRLACAEEDERRRIARELHDQLGQQMTALRLTLETLKVQPIDTADVRLHIETLEELARQLDQDIAFRVWELRPLAIKEVGLRAALTNFVHNWARHFGIRVQLHTSEALDNCTMLEVETMMYRLAQEALNNVAKHARATRVDVALECTNEYLTLVVEDDGVGFDPLDPETIGDGLGLLGMRERAALFGGDLQIESAPGNGTTVIVRAPLNAAKAEDV